MAEEAEALMELHKVTSVAILAHNIITHPTRQRLKMKIACLISDSRIMYSVQLSGTPSFCFCIEGLTALYFPGTILVMFVFILCNH